METTTGTKLTVLIDCETAIQEMESCLSGFWAADKWDMAESPLLPEDTTIRHTFIEFDHPSALLNIELKYACWCKFSGGGWSPKAAPTAMGRVRPLVRFLKEGYPDTQSLMEKDLDEWVSAFQTYLNKNRPHRISNMVYVDSQQHIRQYKCSDGRVSALRGLYKLVLDAYDKRPEHEKDVWDVRKLGVALTPSDLGYSLNFTCISQPWLRLVAKRYIRYRSSVYSLSSCRWSLNAINHFSAFLEQHPNDVQPADVDRSLVTDYLSYLASTRPGARGRQQSITQIRMFLETCAREGWADFPEKRLIFEEDIPRKSKRLPRTIPDDVLIQLNQHLNDLQEPYRTMAIVVQECGLRLGELRSIPLDCLVQDQDGDWFLRYYQWKMKKEHSIPITCELAEVIQERQRAVRNEWENECSVLFPNGRGKPVHNFQLSRALNSLAVQKDIRDSTGQLFRFRAHDFRHTVATRLLRGGVRQHHVQKYLGHESPEMTMVYAEITDQDLKRAYQEYQGLLVDVTGKVVTDDQVEADAIDLQWFKKNIMAQALPHGYCALPVIAEPCPVPNACLTCASFRTNGSFLGVLKAELDATEELIGKAKSHNWIRQAEMNERVAVNLRRIIDSLEEGCDASSKEC